MYMYMYVCVNVLIVQTIMPVYMYVHVCMYIYERILCNNECASIHVCVHVYGHTNCTCTCVHIHFTWKLAYAWRPCNIVIIMYVYIIITYRENTNTFGHSTWINITVVGLTCNIKHSSG